jgi:endonuclease/exonuclease/phosphatase family metal-dependent hydrolase
VAESLFENRPDDTALGRKFMGETPMSQLPPLSELGSDREAYLPMYSYFGNMGRVMVDPGVEENVMLPTEVHARDEDIDVAFWNIEWFNKNVDLKVRAVARFIADMNLDVWALEETSPRATERLVHLLEEAYGLDFDFGASEPEAPNSKQSTTVMWNRATVIGTHEAWPDEIAEVLRLSSRDDLTPLEQLEDIEEAIHGKIFDRYPGLFHLQALQHQAFDFYLVPLHLKAMAEGSLRRQLASRVLGAAVRKMIRDGADADWVLGGDLNAPLASGDFDALTSGDLKAVSAQDASDGAISYIKGPKSLIDHIYLSKNMAARFAAGDFFERFTIIAADREIPNYAKTISDHRPVMIRLHLDSGVEEGASSPFVRTPDWLKR